MITLNIEGANVEALYLDAVKTLSLLVRGGQQFNAGAPQPQTAPEPANAPAPPLAVTEAIAEPVGDVTVMEALAPVEKKPRKARGGKFPKAGESAAAEDLPAFLDRGKPAADASLSDDPFELNPKTAPPAQTELTDEVMRARVREILAAHGPEGRGNTMDECVVYVRKLFLPFGVKLSVDIKPARRAEFMLVSQQYLDGIAE